MQTSFTVIKLVILTCLEYWYSSKETNIVSEKKEINYIKLNI